MKKYKNNENGRVALLVVDNLTKTMKYEDDGSEVIITPASLKHEWVFLEEVEAAVEPKQEEKPVESVPVTVEVKPEEPKVEVPVEPEVDSLEDVDSNIDPYEKLLKQGIRKDVVESLRRVGALDS